MKLEYRIDKDILYIALEDCIDSSNAAAVEEAIFAIRNDHKGKHIVLDADKLAYIASAGLRVILKLGKAEPKLAIINVPADVYRMMQYAGFTEILTIEKAYRRISLDDCEFIAKGANGAVYRYNDETVVKYYFAKDALPEIKREHENARRAFRLGVNTAIPYDIVRVGDGYGVRMEILNAVSVARMFCGNPENMQQAVKYYIDAIKDVHAIEVRDDEVPDMRKTALSWMDFMGQHICREDAGKLHALIETIPRQNTLLHGDYNANNVMVQNGEPILIDMDTLCMGHPIFELSFMFNSFVGFFELDEQVATRFCGYTREAGQKFWDMALKMYLGTEEEAVCRSIEEKAKVLGYTRMLRRALRRPDEPDSPEKIARCKEMLHAQLKRVDTLAF